MYIKCFQFILSCSKIVTAFVDPDVTIEKNRVQTMMVTSDSQEERKENLNRAEHSYPNKTMSNSAVSNSFASQSALSQLSQVIH